MKKIPLRRCLVTKESLPKEELFRVVRLPSGEVVLDTTYKANGRGAYIKKSEEIILKAKEKKVLEKALESDIDEDVYKRMLNYLKMK